MTFTTHWTPLYITLYPSLRHVTKTRHQGDTSFLHKSHSFSVPKIRHIESSLWQKFVTSIESVTLTKKFKIAKKKLKKACYIFQKIHVLIRSAICVEVTRRSGVSKSRVKNLNLSLEIADSPFWERKILVLIGKKTQNFQAVKFQRGWILQFSL